jgi:hypothetical protein
LQLASTVSRTSRLEAINLAITMEGTAERMPSRILSANSEVCR